MSDDLTQEGRVLRRLGQGPRQPAWRAKQRDEAAIAQWRASHFPELKTGPGRRSHHPLGDASRFYLFPTLWHARVPAAQTPIIRRQLRREHLGAISAVSITGELHWPAPGRPYQSDDVVWFRQQPPDAMLGKPLMIGDGAPIHRSRAVR